MAENHIATHADQVLIARILIRANQNSISPNSRTVRRLRPITNNTQPALIILCCIGEKLAPSGSQKLK